MIALQSRRSMRALALMQNANQFVLTACMIAAVLISPTPESLVAGRLVYSYSTLLLALVVYRRLRTQGQVSYPPLRAIFARALYGVAAPLLALRRRQRHRQKYRLAVHPDPAPVGRHPGGSAGGRLSQPRPERDHAGEGFHLRRSRQHAGGRAAGGRAAAITPGCGAISPRVLVVMALVGWCSYGALALVAPFVIPPVLGARWIPAIPPLVALAIYGAITTVGGNFQPALPRLQPDAPRDRRQADRAGGGRCRSAIVLLAQMITAAPGDRALLGRGRSARL